MTIYSDIDGEVLIQAETKRHFVQLYDCNKGRNNPALILDNLLAVERLRNYLTDVLKKYKRR